MAEAIPPNSIIADGNLDFSGGQDAAQIPERVAPNASYALINTTTKNGNLGPRSGYIHRSVTYPDGGVKDSNGKLHTYKDIFESGRYQAAIPYTLGSEYYLIIVVSGVIFLVNQRLYVVSLIPISDGSYLNERATRLNWEAAGRFIVIHDYPAYPVIIDSGVAHRADPAKYEVPISVLGAYNNNRLFIANAGNEFTAGDPAGNKLTPNAPVTFEEVFTPSSPYLGQVFQLPTLATDEVITAMAFLQATDSSTGIGSLLVGTHRAIYSYQTQNPRAQWDAGQFGSLFVFEAGIVGPRAFTNVNSDFFFMSSDGQIRTASMSREEQKRWARVPVSREVQNWLRTTDAQKSLLPYSVMGYFDNKIFATANPYYVPCIGINYPVDLDITHGGLVVMELDNISTLGHDSPPVWGGLWTGIRPMDIVINNDRCFIIAKDASYINQIWEVEPEVTYDTSNGKVRYVRSVYYSKSYDFQDRFQNKQPHSIDIPINNVAGDLNLTVEYKPSHSPNFLPWKDFKHSAPYQECSLPVTCVNGVAKQSFKELNFGFPENEECDPITGMFYRMFRKMQIKFTIKAKSWNIPEFKVRAVTLPQNINETVCGEYPTVTLCENCNTDWIEEDFESCQPTPM